MKINIKHTVNRLEAEAKISDAYAQAMEQTSARTNGRLGHHNAPMKYAAFRAAAARKREQAAMLRNKCEEVEA
tara:strand:- start:406 stop:624 length:219 start_codon:yes stop_codon:yes gene_type:complete